VDAGVCGDATGAALEPSAFPLDDWVTEVEPAVVGDVVLWVVWVTTLDPPAEPGEVVGVGLTVVDVLMDCSTAMLGFEPPPPLTGTVVATGVAVVLVAAAGAVLGGVLAGAVAAGAVTDVAGALLLPVVP
jgi:hypothetical protein